MALQGVSGFDCVLTIGGVTAGKTRNFDPTYTAADQDTTTRDADGWKKRKSGLKEWTATIEKLWVPTDTALAALWTAYNAGTVVTVEWTDPDGYGRSGDAIVLEFHPGPQDLDNAVMVSISLASDGAVTLVTSAS